MNRSYKHMKFNAIGNIFALGLMIIALTLKDWATVGGLDFSLREINFKKLGGWVEMGKFKTLCTKYNISLYPDIHDDCLHLSNFEMGGILVKIIQYILFSVFAMGIQCYNILSSFCISYQLKIEVLEVEVSGN